MPESIVPDTKDWTWVLDRPCEECGFDAAAHSLAELPRRIHDSAMVWTDVLRRPDAGARPAPDVWSPLEYACHVRDVHRVFAERVTSMLDEDEPRFADWDQDAAAIEGRYGEQDPVEVDVALVEAAGHVAGVYATVTDETARRTGVRSNGSEFSVLTLGLYHLHDVLHHVHDVRR